MGYVPQISFYLDTDGYSDRDRDMFVAGYEFALIAKAMESGDRHERPIHRENESRVRLLCGKLNRTVTISPHKGYEGCETWSQLVIEEGRSVNPDDFYRED